MNRRTFIKQASLATAGGLSVISSPLRGQNAPSNKVVIAVMGVNGRGAYHLRQFSKMAGVEVGYICEVEEGATKKGFNAVKGVARQPVLEKDIRRLVERKDFDALVIAAPDHWHAPAALLGVAHGKHVYVEKPAGHNPRESELLVQAAAKHRRLIQVGSQRRSFPYLIEARKLVAEGLIGTPYMGKSWYVNNRKPIGRGKKVPVPPTLDFDLWQGPAPRKDFQDNLVHYNWHWFWHWGTGESCNNGNHEIDCLRWFLGVDFPTKVTSAGGRYAAQDDWETPDTQVAAFEFGAGKVITWEGRSCNSYPVDGGDRGFIVYGTNGTIVNGTKVYDARNQLVREFKTDIKADSTDITSSTGDADAVHLANFIAAIRGEAKLNAPIDEAHRSVLLCHLANIAQRTGATLQCDPKDGRITGHAAASALWGRTYEPGWEMKV
jgi:predicted dehydrogenase